MRELYLDLSMGAAGDMISAALLELCDDKDYIISALNSMGVPELIFSAEKFVKHSICGTHMKVEYKGLEENPDSPESHGHHRHGYADICRIIDGLNLNQKVREDAKKVYALIAGAEAQVHGKEMDNIHFHELGTMDAVADITAACFIIDYLKPEHISASPVCTGFGTVRCAHGVMPVPAPATAQLLEGMPVFPGDIAGEMCTPTGAAIIKHFAESFDKMPPMTVLRTGCGMGTKDFNRPNCLRATLGESQNTMIELCCNVDDMSPESVGFALEELMRQGAADAWYECIGMKKSRPGLMLCCLCGEKERDKMVELIFKHTSTLGIREAICRRYILKRESSICKTPYGDVRIKAASGYGVERRKAEYDDLARISREHNLSIEDVRKLTE